MSGRRRTVIRDYKERVLDVIYRSLSNGAKIESDLYHGKRTLNIILDCYKFYFCVDYDEVLKTEYFDTLKKDNLSVMELDLLERFSQSEFFHVEKLLDEIEAKQNKIRIMQSIKNKLTDQEIEFLNINFNI